MKFNRRQIHPVIILMMFLVFEPFAPATEIKPTVALLPRPVETTFTSDCFLLQENTPIRINSPQLQSVATGLQTMLSVPSGYPLPVKQSSSPVSLTKTGISLELLDTPDPKLGDEGYRLDVTPDRIRIRANQPAGIFHGTQTLQQLLPDEIESRERISRTQWPVAGARIVDYPRFAWRGLLLDVARHFFSKEDVMDLIDQMARRKLNILHLHLTDDQGWRIEIKSHPELTAVGAWRVPRVGVWRRYSPRQPGEKATEGGYYTQDDICEIIAYAQARFVTILPEIEMPGHALAMIAANPDLSCLGLPYDVASGRVNRRQGERDNVLCIGNPRTYEVVADVIAEVAELFPGKYLHLGADETSPRFWLQCDKCQALARRENLIGEDQLQPYFTRRVEQLVRDHGKTMIGWEEIVDDGIAPGTPIMSYRPGQAEATAIAQGTPLIIADSDHYYFDQVQGTAQLEPNANPRPGNMIRLIDTYHFDPVPAGADDAAILGGEGCLWTEKVRTVRKMQYMFWPRALALAERLWTPQSHFDWPDFTRRMIRQLPRLDLRNINHAPSAFEPIVELIGEGSNQKIRLKTEIPGVELHYTFDGSDPDQYYPRYETPLTLPRDANEIRVVAYWQGKRIGRQLNHVFFNPFPDRPEKPVPPFKTIW
ncbi:MAG: family 20 glycosylhydrolase [Opitutaceae bacterium]|nr:family 20 glycosylhydrolase [Cephaloticoccus sp.]MCP5530402.1 family 20 glycosylhydrolase [Opitutaceae bacterium]